MSFPPQKAIFRDAMEADPALIAARQNPCELISHLHRQPFALEVYVDYRQFTFLYHRRILAPNAPGKWINNLKGVRLVPYRLPELIAAIAADEPVSGSAKPVYSAAAGACAAFCSPKSYLIS